jgi:hypothetical protein
MSDLSCICVCERRSLWCKENIEDSYPIEKLERQGYMSFYTEPHGLDIPHHSFSCHRLLY